MQMSSLNEEQPRGSTSLNPPPHKEAPPELDGDTIDLHIDEEGSREIAKKTIMGKIISTKTLNKGETKNILSKAWNNPELNGC